MPNLRVFLWLALLFVVWLNVDAWMKDYGRGPPATPTTPAGPAAATPSAGSLTEALPTLGATQPAATAAAGRRSSSTGFAWPS